MAVSSANSSSATVRCTLCVPSAAELEICMLVDLMSGVARAMEGELEEESIASESILHLHLFTMPPS